MLKLTPEQKRALKHANLVDLSRQARKKTASLINDQGFAVLSVAVSNFIVEAVEHPENLTREPGG